MTRTLATILALLIPALVAHAGKGDPVPAKEVSEETLRADWKKLTDDEADAVTKRHLMGLVAAMHAYFDMHDTLPPAVIANPNLPEGKRLSGLVLILPYLGTKGLNENKSRFFDEPTIRAANEAYKLIDQKKGWDDPANRKAAQMLIPGFLNPRGGKFRNDDGVAVTHFAMARGSEKGYDGAFPGTEGVRISEITDGTTNTLALGQINHDLGPWIAEGLSTARQLHLPEGENVGSFGGADPAKAWFATCDGAALCVRFDKSDGMALQGLATRAGGEVINGGIGRCGK